MRASVIFRKGRIGTNLCRKHSSSVGELFGENVCLRDSVFGRYNALYLLGADNAVVVFGYV